MQIAERTIARFHYILTNAGGEVLDSSRDREPLAYLHGAGNIVPGLEQAMTGRKSGDSFQIEVAPEEGYGPRHEGLVQKVSRTAFQGVEHIELGMSFEARTPQGVHSVVVTQVTADAVTVDANHPLAGQVLHFDIEIIEVRAASAEELAHGHAHGLGGQHQTQRS